MLKKKIKEPIILCRLLICIPQSDALNSDVITNLNKIGFNNVIEKKPKFVPEILYILNETQCITWELDDAISLMFSGLAEVFENLSSVVEHNGYNVIVDVNFPNGPIFPAMIISNANLKKMSTLNARLSIDIC